MTNMMKDAIGKTMQAKWVFYGHKQHELCFCYPSELCLSVLFLKLQKFMLPPVALNYTNATRSRVELVSCPFSILILRISYVVETYIQGTSWKGCHLVMWSRLIYVYFTNQESSLLISAAVWNGALWGKFQILKKSIWCNFKVSSKKWIPIPLYTHFQNL